MSSDEIVHFVGGPKDGETVAFTPVNYWLFPQSGGGTHWYKRLVEANPKTREYRRSYVYLGLSHSNDPPDAED